MQKPYHDIKWNTLKENIVFQNKYITLFNNLVEKPDKKQINFLKMKTGDFVTVFCRTKENKVVLVRQYRYAFDNFSYEFPGGIVDKGETPLESAKREVLEETGYQVLDLQLVLKSHPNAYSTAWAYTFIAIVEKFGDQHLDDNEFILVEEFDKSEVFELIEKGEFVHAPSLMCLLMSEKFDLV